MKESQIKMRGSYEYLQDDIYKLFSKMMAAEGEPWRKRKYSKLPIRLGQTASKTTPAQELGKQKKETESLLKNVNEMTAALIAKLEKQTKQNPNSWAGIGRGAELADVTTQIEELERTLKALITKS